jgi:MoxR-like ATPase
LLCGRFVVSPTDLWILRYIWDTEEQQEVIATIVQDAVNRHLDDEIVRHPRAQGNEVPNAEELARDLERLDARINGGDLNQTTRVYLRDQLGVLSGRVPWVADSQQRSFLEEKLARLWERIGRPE